MKRFDPDQIILLGSCAHSEDDENSDLTLLVIRPVAQAARSPSPRIAVTRPSRRTTLPRQPHPPRHRRPLPPPRRPPHSLARHLLKYRQDPDSMLSRMLEDSEVLYKRHAA